MSNAEDINQLIESGFDINSKNDNDITLLHEFTIEGNLKGVKSLLEHEADFNAVDKENRNPLHYAVIYKRKKIAKLLISKLTVNSKDKNGFTPLHLAVLHDDIEMINLLIANDAKVNVHNLKEGNTPLHIASLYGSQKSVQILINHGANLESKNNNSHTPLFSLVFEYAAHCESRIKILEYLIQRGVNVETKDIEGNTILFLAAYNNQLQIIKLIAQKQSNKKFAELLVTKNKQGFDPIDCIIESGNEQMMKFLISKGITINSHNFNINMRLHKASYNGNIEALKLLLKLKVNVNSVTKCGKTSLHLAAKKGHIEVIKMLLESGANMNIQDPCGYTALHIAIKSNHLNIAQLLTVKGADFNIKCNNNYDPIDLLVHQSHEKPENYEKFHRFFILYLKELYYRHKKYHIFSMLVLCISIIGLPFVLKFIMKYREETQIYQTIKVKLKNCIFG